MNISGYSTILQSDAKAPFELSAFEAKGVLDQNTFKTIEVDKLFEAFDPKGLDIGKATLYRSLSQPLDSFDDISKKQQALVELESNPKLKSDIEALLKDAQSLEKDFYGLLYGSFLGAFGSPAHPLEFQGYGYESYIKGTRFMLELVARAQALPQPDSLYLQELIQDIRSFATSRAYALMSGPVYRSEKGILTRAEKSFFTPAIKFRPSLFKPVGLGLTILLLGLILEFAPILLEAAASILPAIWLFILPLSLVYIPIVGGFDRDSCIYPLRKIFKNSSDVQKTLDALGKLDELFSFLNFKQSFHHPMVLPELMDKNQHVMELNEVRNPILAKDNPAYVANSVSLKDTRLAFVTGPNSGGKTAFCKTLAQVQLLAQIGCYVPAEKAQLSVADKIFYQVPEISHLSDGEGRFGTELKRTRDIFMACGPNSLVIMDELSEGTTHEEKIEISINILEGFLQKSNNTVLITHNHELVEHFTEKQIGLALQVEFKQELPTYKLIEGISKISHANRVAQKIGFAKEDIARMLES